MSTKQVSIIVNEDGNIQIDNQDFQSYEFVGLLQSILQHHQQKQQFENALSYIQSNPEFREVLREIVNEEVKLRVVEVEND